MKKYLVIGLGNLVLSDDAVGPLAVRRAEEALSDISEYVDFKENYAGGLDMLYDMAGYDKAILVDCITTGACQPGTCLEYRSEDFEQLKQGKLVDSHGINLPTVLDLGRQCGYRMPEDFIIFAVEAEDITTFAEKLSESVEAALDDIVGKIRETIVGWINQQTKDEK